jgi:hypothetical protein
MYRMISFYIPLGASALLASLTHIIISSVLARSSEPEVTISGYAIALGLAFILEQTISLLRQTSAKFVRDQRSFSEMVKMVGWIVGVLLAINILVAWSPLGILLFKHLYGVKEAYLDSTMDAYRILMFVCVFSAVRSLYQGIIIRQLRTKWMTIGMVVRLLVMALMSWGMITFGWTDDSRYGAILFLVGMAIESAVAWYEGRSLQRRLPEQEQDYSITNWRRDFFPFYVPLLYGSMIGIVLGPATQKTMSVGTEPVIAIAAFAVAGHISNLVSSFCSFTHQLVLNFYEQDKRRVQWLTASLSILSAVVLGSIAWTPLGDFILRRLIGIEGELLLASSAILSYFVVKVFIYPWTDYYIGIAMLRGKTKVVAWGKVVTVSVCLGLLLWFALVFPHWNGLIPARAGAIVAILEIALLMLLLRDRKKN